MRGIQLVTLSSDSPEVIRNQRHKHGSKATMLSDAELEVTDRYGLRNPTNLTPGGVKGMPIPTTLLVDAEGIVRWIDQSTNYQERSHPETVLGAIEANL